MLNRAIFLAAIALFGGFALGQSYSVTGEVRHPGIYSLSGKTSVLRALTLAGGTTPSADVQNAVVIRGHRRIPVDVQSLIRGRIQDVPLMDGDELLIPRKDGPYYLPIATAIPKLRAPLQ